MFRDQLRRELQAGLRIRLIVVDHEVDRLPFDPAVFVDVRLHRFEHLPFGIAEFAYVPVNDKSTLISNGLGCARVATGTQRLHANASITATEKRRTDARGIMF